MRQAGQLQSREVGTESPWRLKTRTAREYHTEREGRHLIDQEIEELSRGRIDPVQVFDHQEHGPLLGP